MGDGFRLLGDDSVRFPERLSWAERIRRAGDALDRATEKHAELAYRLGQLAGHHPEIQDLTIDVVHALNAAQEARMLLDGMELED